MTSIQQTGSGRLIAAAIALVAFATLATIVVPAAQAQSFAVLHTFNGKAQGGQPYGAVIFDASGNLLGTTSAAGNPNDCSEDGGCGVVFRLSSSTSGLWPETVIYNFLPSTGGTPTGTLLLNSAGDIYGVVETGGGAPLCGGAAQGCGVVWELSPLASGGYQESALQTFDDGPDGGIPYSAVIADAAGNLYGTTTSGGNTSACGGFGCGVVYRLSPNGSGGYTETILYAFNDSSDGSVPYASLIMDAAGNLFGTTFQGGHFSKACFSQGCGVVFELSPSPSGSWTESVLHTFQGSPDGTNPIGGVVLDASGNLWGTTGYGGSRGYGTVFELTPQAGSWKETLVHSFTGGSDGNGPFASVILDSAGNIYGTTSAGGNLNACTTGGCGVVFKLAKVNGAWSESVLHAFTNVPDGSYPEDALAFGSDGNLYGTALFGGVFNQGTVFRVAP
jgi:uncharacterized repeat protein (TIGR03803 family)